MKKSGKYNVYKYNININITQYKYNNTNKYIYKKIEICL